MGVAVDPERRFWTKVDKRGQDECWPWQGFCRPDGHGMFSYQQKLASSHAVALILSGFPKPEGKMALHSCDNPPCCNPKHLRWGTSLDNVRDMHDRGRLVTCPGEKNASAKLTEDIVLEIGRLSHLHGERGAAAQLAREYGVCSSTIVSIWSGRSWSTVTGLTNKRKPRRKPM